MLEFLKIACIDTVLVLDPSDNHAKQVELNLTNSFSHVQRLYPKEVIDQFEHYLIILRTRDRNLIEPEYLGNDAPEALKEEIDKIPKQDLDVFVEGWTNTSIAWQSNYALKIFKDTYSQWISIHSQILKDKRPLTIQEMTKREK